MSNPVRVFDNVPDCVGYLIMDADGSVEHSHGDLQNNENAANLIHKMVLCAIKVSVHPTKQMSFKRFTGRRRETICERMAIDLFAVSDDQYVYCISCANNRIYAVKRRQESTTMA